MSREHDDDSWLDQVLTTCAFARRPTPGAAGPGPLAPDFLQAWDDWWSAGRFGRLRNPPGGLTLQIRQGHWPPQAPTPLPLLATPAAPLLEDDQAPTLTAEDVLWSEILAQLRLQLTKATFETWLKETRLASRDGNRFTLAVPSGFARDWLEHRLQGVIRRAIAQVADVPPDQLELRFQVGVPTKTPS
ncbi:MAG: DnaA N-terminal domain-containing protein [Anaerolineae bacterium]